jgi:hypothetical protein
MHERAPTRQSTKVTGTKGRKGTTAHVYNRHWHLQMQKLHQINVIKVFPPACHNPNYTPIQHAVKRAHRIR